jgi:hypothetical protein
MKRKQSVERRCLGTVKGCTRLDHTGNEDIRNDLKTHPATNKIDELRQN